MSNTISNGELIVYIDDDTDMLGKVIESETSPITGQTLYLVDMGDGKQTWMNSWAIRPINDDDLYAIDSETLAMFEAK